MQKTNKRKEYTMKRNAKGGGSIRQREDGTWEARCTINGKRRSFYADRQSDALKAMRQALSAADNGTFTEPSKMTLQEWIGVWLNEYVKPFTKQSTYYSYKNTLERYVIPVLGKRKMASINTTQIQIIYNDMMMKKGLSNKTVRNLHGTLHKVFQQAVELNYLAVNPTTKCKQPKPDAKKITPLEETDIEAFLSALEGHKYKSILTVTLFTGMRVGEVCGLPWDAVDFKRGTITIKQQLQRHEGTGEYIIETPKHDKFRTIPAPPFVLDILRNVGREQGLHHIENHFMWKNENNLVFTNDDGSFINPRTLYKNYKKIVKQIGRPDARLHDLRHTYAVTALQEGDDFKTLQDNLGHATAAFTLNVYGHVSEKMKQESANRMEKYYQKVKA